MINIELFAGGSGLASYTPSKVDLTSEGFELGVTRAVPMIVSSPTAATGQSENASDVEYLRPAQDAGAWGSETTGDLLYWRDDGRNANCKLYSINSSTSLRSNRMKGTYKTWKVFSFFFSSVDEIAGNHKRKHQCYIEVYNKKIYDECSHNYIKKIFL